MAVDRVIRSTTAGPWSGCCGGVCGRVLRACLRSRAGYRAAAGCL